MLIDDFHEDDPSLRLTVYVQEANELEEAHDWERFGEEHQDDYVYTFASILNKLDQILEI